MGGILEEIIKNKEELLVKFLQVAEGKETGVKVNLDGVVLKIGETKIKLTGDVEFLFVPFKKK